MEHKNDDNNKKPLHHACSLGWGAGSRLGIWQRLSHVLLRLLFAYTCMCARFFLPCAPMCGLICRGTGRSVQTRATWQKKKKKKSQAVYARTRQSGSWTDSPWRAENEDPGSAEHLSETPAYRQKVMELLSLWRLRLSGVQEVVRSTLSRVRSREEGTPLGVAVVEQWRHFLGGREKKKEMETELVMQRGDWRREAEQGEREREREREREMRRRWLPLKESQEVVLIANWPRWDDGWSIGDH